MNQVSFGKHNFRPNGFTFKQFFVAHDCCGMKVGTDSILLGAWTALWGDEEHILDIGTGSGLLALMMAQRSNAMVDAVEIDVAAAQQAQTNFMASPWGARLSLHALDIAQFARQPPQYLFDLIITNPPYHLPGLDCRDEQRHSARYTHFLSHEDVLRYSYDLATPTGRLALVLPLACQNMFLGQAKKHGWSLMQQLTIQEREGLPSRLSAMLLCKSPCQSQRGRLIIRQQEGCYSADFRQLTQDFYVK